MTAIFFATNRKLISEKQAEFSDGFDERLDELRFGRIEFEGANLFKQDVGAIAAKGRITVAPEKLSKHDADHSQLGSKTVFTDVQAVMRGVGDLLVFLHGYNHTFREAAARAVQLQQWLASGGHELALMMFAWPSAGAGVAPRTYSDDRQRAKCSGLAFGRALLKATDFIRGTARKERCGGRIHLLAHSMGNWAVTGAIQAMRTYVGDNIPPLFDEVLLVAADEDNDTLASSKKMAPILRGSRRVTVYYNQQDLALKASDVAMGNPDRLGRSGPVASADLSSKITSVNVSPTIVWDAKGRDAWTKDETGHQYYRNNTVVRRDMLQVLAGTLDEDIEGRARRVDYWRLG
jgi:esterase/lipase superfamily enzyme